MTLRQQHYSMYIIYNYHVTNYYRNNEQLFLFLSTQMTNFDTRLKEISLVEFFPHLCTTSSDIQLLQIECACLLYNKELYDNQSLYVIYVLFMTKNESN